MKKIILSTIVFITLSVQAFALKNRFFEIKTEVPVNVSNSSFFISDIFQDEYIIDLPAISDGLPNSGWKLNLFAAPAVSMNLDLRFLYVGIKTGVEVQSATSISRDLFDFLGKGYTSNQIININASCDNDVFLFIDTTVKFNVKKFKVTVMPGFFCPVVHAEIGKSDMKIQNTDDGEIIFNMDAGIDIYSQYTADIFEHMDGFEFQQMFQTVGFDLGGAVQYEILPGLELYGYMRIPIIPGQLKKRVNADFSFSGSVNIMGLLEGKSPEGFEPKFSNFKDADGEFAINRPFKMMVGANWDGFGEWLNIYADLGLGVRYPFSETPKVYPEYILGADLSLFNIIGLTVKTEYVDMIFAHKLGVFLNTRLFEIDVGVAAAGSSFLASFKLGGVGAYVALSFGF